MGTSLLQRELRAAAAILAESLGACEAEVGIIGSAAVSLLAEVFSYPASSTADIDVIVQPDPAKNISADSISHALITKFPERFVAIDEYGIKIPAIALQRGTERILVEVEILDVDAWPNRPQYNLRSTSSSRTAIQIEGSTVHILNAGWLLREKILLQAQREGTLKEGTDMVDIRNLANTPGINKMTYDEDGHVAALKRLIEKRPDMKDQLENVINCSAVFC